MSKTPEFEFYIGEEVVEQEKKCKGTVISAIWHPHIPAYKYKVEFVADKLDGPDTVWRPAEPGSIKDALEISLDKAYKYGRS